MRKWMPLYLGFLVFIVKLPWITEAWWHIWIDAFTYATIAYFALQFLRPDWKEMT